MEEMVNLISNYIFPVAMCLILIWKMEKDQERYRDDGNANREIISQNSQILTEIKTMLQEMKRHD